MAKLHINAYRVNGMTDKEIAFCDARSQVVAEVALRHRLQVRRSEENLATGGSRVCVAVSGSSDDIVGLCQYVAETYGLANLEVDAEDGWEYERLTTVARTTTPGPLLRVLLVEKVAVGA